MMITYMSDLHLERAEPTATPAGGRVLALCGDVLEARLLSPEREDALWRRRRAAALGWLEEAAARFERVFYVPGNHEYYGATVAEAHAALETRLPGGVEFVENAVREHGGVRFVCGALWTDMDGGRAAALGAARRVTDFAAIRGAAAGARFTPEDARARHLETRALIDAEARRAAADPGAPPLVALTHHCPSMRCWPWTRIAASVRHAFCSDMERFISARPGLRAWICGHTHVRKRFDIGGCALVMNPRGYFYGPHHPRTERVALSFDPDTTLRIG